LLILRHKKALIKSLTKKTHIMKILKTICILTLFFLATNSIVAQGWGARAGINFSSASNGDLGKTSGQTGGYLGVYKEISILPKLLFIQPEVQFSKQGFNTNTTDFDLNYIQVPVLAKVYALKIVSFEAGPQFGFKISDKIDGPQNPDFNSFDMAWAVGMSFNLPLGLSLNGRYISSFNEATKSDGHKNEVIQLGASFTF
jgi:hypothetical protein